MINIPTVGLLDVQETTFVDEFPILTVIIYRCPIFTYITNFTL